jgi:hypothetical protein
MLGKQKMLEQSNMEHIMNPRLVGILQRRVQQLLSQREMTHGVWEKNRVQITVVTAAGVVLNHDD